MNCEFCSKPILHPFRSQQRFCCAACSEDFYLAERREAVAWYRACGLRPTTPQQEKQS